MLDQEKDTSVKYVPPLYVSSTPHKVAPGFLGTRRPLLQTPTFEKAEEPISKQESQLEVMPGSNKRQVIDIFEALKRGSEWFNQHKNAYYSI